VVVALSVYGHDYYFLEQRLRPFSPKHNLLKPGGVIGIRLGMLGLLLYGIIFLYPLRKRWKWLGGIGKTKHWLDFHILVGLVTPVLITFHSSFKVQGIAGVAYWIMLAVVCSGITGRYLYAQIPRTLTAAEMSLREVEDLRLRLTGELKKQDVLSETELGALFQPPNTEEVQKMPLMVAIRKMVVLDVKRPVQIWMLRRKMFRVLEKQNAHGARLLDRNKLEQAIATVKMQAVLSKKIVFFSKAQRLFHLWHLIHRPFSYSFAVLLLLHVSVVLLLGYF
jgi:hypothetical protein